VLVTEAPCNVSASTLAVVDQLPQLQACARFASSCRCVTHRSAPPPPHPTPHRSDDVRGDVGSAALVFPPGKYWLNGSLNLSVTALFSRDGGLSLSSLSGQQDVQLCRCVHCLDTRCPADDISPTVVIGDPYPPSNPDGTGVVRGYEGTSGVTLTNIFVSGAKTAVQVVNAAGVKIQNCRVAAGLTNTLDSHGHPSTAPLSIANSFEIFMDGSSFYNAGNGSLPAVIMRGLPDGVDHGFSRAGSHERLRPLALSDTLHWTAVSLFIRAQTHTYPRSNSQRFEPTLQSSSAISARSTPVSRTARLPRAALNPAWSSLGK